MTENPLPTSPRTVAAGPTEVQRPTGSPLSTPNLITLSRLALALVLFGMIDAGGLWITSAILFIVAAATDALDGYIARKYGLVTVLGRILDPFVDKVIVGGTFIFLMKYPGSGVGPWMVVAVIGREMFVTSLRALLEQQGRDFSAVWSGKIKMVLQCAAVVASLLSLSPLLGPASTYGTQFQIVRDVLLWGAVIATLYSGYVYVIRAIALFRSSS